jgi:hypothetical protein
MVGGIIFFIVEFKSGMLDATAAQLFLELLCESSILCLHT